MYSVVGSDGQVYGPVPVDTLKEWIQQGRIEATTNLIDPISGGVMHADHLDALREVFYVAPPVIVKEPPVILAPPPVYGVPPAPYQQPGPPASYPMMNGPIQQAAAFQQGVPGAPSVQVNNYVALNNQAVVTTIAPSDKNKTTAILLCLFLGGLGIHRYYLGRNGSATAMLLITVGSVGYLGIISFVWAIVDLIQLCTGSLRDAQDRALT